MGTWKKNFSCSQIIASTQHKYDLTGAGRGQPGRRASMAEDLNSGRPRNTPNLWSELESPDSESDALATQPRFLLMVPYRNYNKSKSLNEKRSLIPWVFRVPYVLHEFLQISSLCKEVYIGVSQAKTKLFPRTCYTKCASKPEGYHFNAPNHPTDIILQSAVFLHTRQHGKPQKCTELRKGKSY